MEASQNTSRSTAPATSHRRQQTL